MYYLINLFSTRILFILFFPLLLGLNSCKSKQNAQGINQKKIPCGILERVNDEVFHDSKTAHYQLDKVAQKGNNLILNISTDVPIGQNHLYWTGMTRRSYPPQTTVKLIIKESPRPVEKTKMKKHTLCFDMKDMDNDGLMTIYIMDDEEVIEFDFSKDNSK